MNLRKRILAFSAAVVLLAGSTNAQALSSKDFKITKIPGTYHEISQFTGGMAYAGLKSGPYQDFDYAFINKNGTRVTGHNYSHINTISAEGVAAVGITPAVNAFPVYGMIDNLGQEVLPFTYGNVYFNGRNDFVAGDLAIVQAQSDPSVWNTPFGLTDSNGNEILSQNYKQILDEGYRYISLTDTNDTHFVYDRLDGSVTKIGQGGGSFSSFHDGAAYQEKNGEYIYVDLNGKKLFSFKRGEYYRPDNFSEGLVCLLKGANQYGYKGKYGYLNKDGDEAIPFEFDDAYDFKNGYALVGIKDEDRSFFNTVCNYGMIDKDGDWVIAPVYPYLTSFSDGLAAFSKTPWSQMYGYVNSQGIEVIPAIYDAAEPFVNGLARVRKGDYWGVIDKTGREVVPFIYQKIGEFSEGFAVVKKNDKLGVIDTSGNLVLPCEYDYFSQCYENSGLFPKFSDGALVLSKGGYIGAGNTPTNVQWYIIHNPYITKGRAVTPNTASITVDGKMVSMPAYNIEGNNYFKLRDLAAAINGSEKQFNVTWNTKKQAVEMLSESAYQAVGGELSAGPDGTQTAYLSQQLMYCDGLRTELSAYNIGGNNYFKLRDICELFDIGVTWNAAERCIGIETDSPYFPG